MGRKKAARYNEPLTKEQQQFAEKHHNIIYGFLHAHPLFKQQTDSYGTAAIGYLKAVITQQIQH